MLSLKTIFIMFILLAFVLTNHPLIMGASLILTRIAMGVSLAQLASSAWIAYILVIIFVRGIIIIILYISRLSSNEVVPPNTFTKKSYVGLAVITLMLRLGCSTPKSYLITIDNFYTNPLFKIVYKTYSQLIRPATILIIIYLLVVLITAVNIIRVRKVPLRSTGE